MSKVLNISSLHNNGASELIVGIRGNQFMIKKELNSENVSIIDPNTGKVLSIDGISASDISEQINTHNMSEVAHSDIREIIKTNLMDIDYEALLAFDTSEIVFGTADDTDSNTTSVLGRAILGQMVLA